MAVEMVVSLRCQIEDVVRDYNIAELRRQSASQATTTQLRTSTNCALTAVGVDC